MLQQAIYSNNSEREGFHEAASEMVGSKRENMNLQGNRRVEVEISRDREMKKRHARVHPESSKFRGLL